MGSALARAFIEAGHRTTVWNRTKEKAEPLGTLGATVAESVRGAVDGVEIVIVNVSDYAASSSLLRADAVSAAVRGKLIVELTTGSPHEAREAANWAEEHGADYLDGAIMASPGFIGTEGGTILFSGPRAAFDANQPALRALGGNVQHVGDDPGTANLFDNALLSLLLFSLFGTMQATALCQAERIDLAELARQWTATAPVVVEAVADLIKRTKAARFTGDDETFASISAYYGGFRHILEISKAHNLDHASLDAYDTIFKRAIAAGHLHDDFAAMTQFMSRPA